MKMRLYEISYFQGTIYTSMVCVCVCVCARPRAREPCAILITPYHQYYRSLLPLFKADKGFPELNISFNDQHKIIII